MNVLIEGGDYTMVILIVLLIMFGIPVILSLIAFFLKNKKPKTAKVLGIIALVYLIISLGYCGVLAI
ncbi:hypothetical protein [Olleya aquimaris]|uniref:Uncharacterized protein n=1 Tax=Olleya aquimaris TaxID=639310 RepID=A0A327RPH7_9FLAO|nr:hypothetical protein [Olleya aquimaris]RAJ17842.1 hypothetical protein LY08_00111 [Olleya aquimaris]